MSSQPESKMTAEAACERCGNFEVLEIAGKFLCSDCVALAGCGCAGHGEENSDS
jgi:hypothetical protein